MNTMAGGKIVNRRLLPLLGVLKAVRPYQRVILMAHLNDKTHDALYRTINKVLRSERVPFRKRLFLRSKLRKFKREFRQLSAVSDAPTTRVTRSLAARKKKALMQVGGSPFSYMLQAAIPLLLNLFPK